MERLCRARGIAPLALTKPVNARPARLSITFLISHVSTLARPLSLARIRFALIVSLRASPVPISRKIALHVSSMQQTQYF
jgi:hypothetical protein